MGIYILHIHSSYSVYIVKLSIYVHLQFKEEWCYTLQILFFG